MMFSSLISTMGKLRHCCNNGSWVATTIWLGECHKQSIFFWLWHLVFPHQYFGIWNNIKSALTSHENLSWSSPIEQKKLTLNLDQFSGQHFMFGAGSVTAGDYQNFVKDYINFKVEVMVTNSFIFCHYWSMQGESCDKMLTFGTTVPHFHIHGPKIFNDQNMSIHPPSWATNYNFCLLRLRQWNTDAQRSPNPNVTNVAKLNRGVINNC